MPTVYIIMGVSGAGKTTIGKLLAQKLALPFFDADDFHPRQNIEKMTSGQPLTDADRQPWLAILNNNINQWNVQGAVLACSALKKSYRTILSNNNNVTYIYLKGNFKTINNRMQKRQHFMKSEMLQSQFDALEPPQNAITEDINKSKEAILSEIMNKIKNTSLADFGIIGMGVMGKSLALNALNKHIKVSVYNRNITEESHIIPNLLQEQAHTSLKGYTVLDDFVNSLASPRKILLMVSAGTAVQAVLDELVPLLNKGDIVMDGGNSHYKDTQKREFQLKTKGIYYLGIGISGGEQGALKGPSIMCGGDKTAYKIVAPILEKIAAKDRNNMPCVGLLGSNGAGHAIKTIHNGIEYAEMQLLAEVYALLGPTHTQEAMVQLLEQWNDNECASFLLETTIAILRKKENDDYLLPKVLDVAKSKGTGTWSAAIALETSTPANCLIEAVQARSISNQKNIRSELSQKVSKSKTSQKITSQNLKNAYIMARLLNHIQGFQLLQNLSDQENWQINLAEVARVWTAGCILQSTLLEFLEVELQKTPILLTSEHITSKLFNLENSLSNLLQISLQNRIAIPSFSSAYQYWLGITTHQSTANIIQAQRDAFGAHTYARTDKPSHQLFTTNWFIND